MPDDEAARERLMPSAGRLSIVHRGSSYLNTETIR
jgi:hypothetical protein